MQTREKPPVVVHPDVESLMKGDILDIRDLILDRAIAVAETHRVEVEQILIRELCCYDEDWSKVIFEMCISTDDEVAFAYWEALVNSVWCERGNLSETAQVALDEEVTIFVHW